MATTYTQIYLQFIFAVKYKAALIDNSWKSELFKYITGIVQNQRHRMIVINGMSDHVHILTAMKPYQSVSDLLQDIKGSSCQWINENEFCSSKFAWQEAYGAFSYSHSHLLQVINHIKNQEKYHRKVSFIEEYTNFLKAFDILFDPKYIFKEPV